ncbi:MAG TPA: hypothetical protein VIE86_04985 [Nitrososphaera sp.]|jgi:hypothetical protein
MQQSHPLAQYSGVKYGAIAGMIATWSISTAIAASEVELGVPISTFYSIMGMSLGVNDFVAAAYLGFGLHILTGTILGAVIGLASVKWTKIMQSPYKAVIAGIVAGIAVWALFFVPVTILLVQPSVDRILPFMPQDIREAMPSGETGKFVEGIVLSSILFHIVWGAIFGYIASSLVRISEFRKSARGAT